MINAIIFALGALIGGSVSFVVLSMAREAKHCEEMVPDMEIRFAPEYMYGHTVQNVVPTPENPVPLENETIIRKVD